MTKAATSATAPRVAYDIALRTVAAQQLWSGRQADSSHKFIPGMLDFHHTVVALQSDIDSESNQAKLASIDQAIERTKVGISEWQSKTAVFVREALPSNAAANPASNNGDSQSVRFGDVRSRQLAMLIAIFDEAAQSALVAASMANDLKLETPSTAQASIRKHAKQIRQLLYLPRARASTA